MCCGAMRRIRKAVVWSRDHRGWFLQELVGKCSWRENESQDQAGGKEDRVARVSSQTRQCAGTLPLGSPRRVEGWTRSAWCAAALCASLAAGHA